MNVLSNGNSKCRKECGESRHVEGIASSSWTKIYCIAKAW